MSKTAKPKFLPLGETQMRKTLNYINERSAFPVSRKQLNQIVEKVRFGWLPFLYDGELKQISRFGNSDRIRGYLGVLEALRVVGNVPYKDVKDVYRDLRRLEEEFDEDLDGGGRL